MAGFVGTLKLAVLQCRGLPEVTKAQKPFIKARTDTISADDNERCQFSPACETSAVCPTFYHPFQFELNGAENGVLLEIRTNSSHLFKSGSSKIGFAYVGIPQLVKETAGKQVWYPLTLTGDKGLQGDVLLSSHYLGKTPEGDWNEEEASLQAATAHLNSQSGVIMSGNNATGSGHIGDLDMTVVKCRDLPRNVLAGKQVPYVKFRLDTTDPRQSCYTSRIPEESNPVFDAPFKFRLNGTERVFLFEVWTDAPFLPTHYRIGQLEIPVDTLVKYSNTQASFFQLTASGKPAGEIMLKIVFSGTSRKPAVESKESKDAESALVKKREEIPVVIINASENDGPIIIPPGDEVFLIQALIRLPKAVQIQFLKTELGKVQTKSLSNNQTKKFLKALFYDNQVPGSKLLKAYYKGTDENYEAILNEMLAPQQLKLLAKRIVQTPEHENDEAE